jgi:hypothetical protein
MTIRLTNNDPAPVYIRALTASWTGNNLEQISLGGTLIWSGNIVSPFVSDWVALDMNRQIGAGYKDLVFTTSRNGPTPTGINVTLDNGCVCQSAGQICNAP